jgi:hypothetical protein
MSPFAKSILPRDRWPTPRRPAPPRGDAVARAPQTVASRTVRARPFAAWPQRGGRLRE